MRTLLATVAVLLVSGCGGTGPSAEPGSRPAPSPPTSTAPSAPAPSPSRGPSRGPSPAPAGPDVADSRACDEVRAGIIAFNLGEYDETVRRFERAVPLAVQQMDGTRASRQLIAAVRYYADLAPDDYPAAAQGSEEFATYKAITLGQCGDGLDQVPTSPTESPQFEA